MLEIRKATQWDAPDISKLGKRTFSDTFGHLFQFKYELDEYLKRTFSIEKIEHSIGKTQNQFWIAFYDDLAIGYSKLKHHSKSDFIDQKTSSCQLQKIYVAREFISKKIGYEMHQHIIKEADRSGYQNIWLSVLASNDKAVNFYKKNNYEIIGEHTFSIGSEKFDFLAMSRILKKYTIPRTT